jgi:hypothetical protein
MTENAQDDVPLLQQSVKPTKAMEELEERIEQLYAKDISPRTLNKEIFKQIAGF